MTRVFLAFVIMVLTLASCEQKPTVQKYFVEKSGQPNFAVVDVAPSFIKAADLNLTAEEKEALNSLKKFNVMIYKKDSLDSGEFKKEAENVKGLLKEDNYDELMKMNLGGVNASISTKGEGENIDEFLVYMNNSDTGFGVIRAIGDDMTPNKVMTIVGLIQKGGIDDKQFAPLKALMGKPEVAKKPVPAAPAAPQPEE
ncbi:MAG: DUF4252 domain-containing protein [Flavobacterium sp.]